MNVLFVSIDSLNRHFLDFYDQSEDVGIDVETPNLDRFADRATVFDSHYAGSLTCMPARREWQTGIQEFLWRPWGPVEPFDTTLPAAAREAGALTQLVTDHYHYFEHGSHGYYEDFNGFEFVRGHETDLWQTTPYEVDEDVLSQIHGERAYSTLRKKRSTYARNIADFEGEEDYFAPKVFKHTARWLRENADWDQWFCYVDEFDVHEPFDVPEPYASMYTDEDPTDPDLVTWPHYGRVDEGQAALTDRQLEFVRSQFAGKLTMVDRWLGRAFDALDEEGLWNETMVVLTADHGHYLGEHGLIGKPRAPVYDVLAHTPLLVWHPDSPRAGGRVDALTSAVDVYATVLDALDAEIPDHVHSESLLPVLLGETDDHRDWALYGYWGAGVNVTDGEYTYLHACDEEMDAYVHSAGMTPGDGSFTPPDPAFEAESGEFLPYADCPVWRYSARNARRMEEDALLFDVAEDPWQEDDLTVDRPDEVERMRGLLVEALEALEAPDYQFDRLHLDRDAA